MNRKALFIVGMHRSGTSAISGEIISSGATPPKTPLPATIDNPKGHCEPKPLVQFHDQLLARIGASWDSWDLQIAQRLQAAFTEHDAATLREIVNAEFGDAELILIKDPRLCFFLPIWLQQAPAMGLTLCPVIVFRSPLEVALSLHKRNGFPSDTSALIWLCHNLLAEQWTRGLPRCVFSIDQFLAQPGTALGGLSERFSLTLNLPPDSAAHFIERDLIHHRDQNYDRLSNGAIRVLTQLTHAALEQLSRPGEEGSASLALLDALRQSFGRQLRLNRRFRRASWQVNTIKQSPLPKAIRGSNIESPRHGSMVGGPVLEIRGWVLAHHQADIKSVEVLEDGALISSTTMLGERPDVATAFPAISEAVRSGIRLRAPLPRDDRNTELEIRARLAPQARHEQSATLARIVISADPPPKRAAPARPDLPSRQASDAGAGPDPEWIARLADHACALGDSGRNDLGLRTLLAHIQDDPAWLSARCDAALYLMSIGQSARAQRLMAELASGELQPDLGRFRLTYTASQLLTHAFVLAWRQFKRVRRYLGRLIQISFYRL